MVAAWEVLHAKLRELSNTNRRGRSCLLKSQAETRSGPATLTPCACSRHDRKILRQNLHPLHSGAQPEAQQRGDGAPYRLARHTAPPPGRALFWKCVTRSPSPSFAQTIRIHQQSDCSGVSPTVTHLLVPTGVRKLVTPARARTLCLHRRPHNIFTKVPRRLPTCPRLSR